jgi:threonine/homoserine/homoserine lactone efflux protein
VSDSYLALALQGLVLGWSVAWPPGPVNAEMIRRGLARGFRPAAAVGVGASAGDFLWAIVVALGAGALVGLPGVRPALGATSFLLLLLLAWTFLSGAWRSWRAARRGARLREEGGRLDSARGGFLLGLAMALSSPWNIAFWLAVIGAQAGGTLSLDRSLVLATAVVIAALAWTVVLCAGVQIGARFATPAWEIGTRAATGVLMLFFAAHLLIRLTR